ncbi:hypothetical protein [Flaviaesturariibacter aridisoli]|uniref:Uncharacterized protein n=1 Tax=Flaviaesturariibacter aridisoli TaxID=2545761 RepID=A0A4R4E698_9BACT|nr:hypothetical protein [Flaviaesturariibacter aridisoli]TCZ74413.1 hypothetical protein E0486_01960 [Flaviaesturariibacter aridisoli]
MRLTLFLSRVAFICNVFFLLMLLLRLGLPARSEALASTIAIAGYFLVLLFNPLANLLCGLLLLRRRLLPAVPRWLALSNFIFLLLQVQYILYINGTFTA